jgi:uncharacterized protein (UPF0548 family)
MILLLPGREPDLNRWIRRDYPPTILDGPRPTDDCDRHARVISKERPGEPLPDGPFRRVATAILDYRVFPPWLITRVMERTPVQVRDTVGLTYRLLPGLRMFVASRVIDVFNEVRRAAFTYRTLAGHAELGEETFAVEKHPETGEITASLTAWSRPGHWLTRIGYPYARWCQLHAGRAALDHLESIARSAEPEASAKARVAFADTSGSDAPPTRNTL